MKDNFEKFFENNREAFDEKIPPAGIWDAIEKKLDEEQDKKQETKTVRMEVRTSGHKWWRAAAILLFAACAWLMIERNLQPAEEQLAQEETSLKPDNDELMQAEVYYTSLIEQKRERIMTLASEESGLLEEFETDIEALDAMYAGLKEELARQKTEKVRDAMIQNLKLRIDILNRQLMILEKIEHENKEEENEAVLI